MLHPSYTEIMDVINSEVEPGEQPVIQSRYSLVIATSKRARQLVDGEQALVYAEGKKPLSIAVEELYKQKIKIVSEDEMIDETAAPEAAPEESETTEE